MINETQAQYIARKGLKPYGGNSPYIFISYSHKDWQKVMPVVEKLSRDGYRVWFDEGIDPGAEWSKNIATRLKSCEICLAFISKNYLNSTNCLDELEYARNHVSQRLLIYLEDAKLPDEIDMRHSRIQALHKYSYQKDEDFYNKLYETPTLKSCLGEESSDVEPPVNSRGRLLAIAAAILVIIVAAVVLLRGCSGSNSDVTTEVIDEDIEEEIADEAEGEAEAAADEAEAAEEEQSEDDDMTEETTEESIEEEIVVTETEDSEVEQEEEEIEEEETTAAIDVPDDAIEYNGHYYLLYEMSDAIDWEDAKERCEKLGGHLVTITSSAEQEFLETNVLSSDINSWLGAYYDEEGIWRWVTDELMCYTDWTQPDKTSSSTYRYLGALGFSWHNFDETGYGKASNGVGKQVTSFVCEWDTTDNVDIEESSHGIDGATIPDDAYEHEGHYYRIYYIGDDMTWDEAEALCETLGGHLTTVTSSAEQTYLETNVYVNGENFWLGGYYNTSGDWVWVTGEVMSYVQWTFPSKTSSSTYRYIGILSYDWHNFNETGYGKASNGVGKQITGYICEWDSDWNPNLETDGDAEEDSTVFIPDDAIEYNGHSYRIYNTNGDLTWTEAQALCENLGGHLATVTSEEEQTFLEINVFKDGINYFLGGMYDDTGNWVWITGEEMDYMQWVEPSESSSLSYRYMGTLSYDWYYFDETGYGKASNGVGKQITGYICEWDTTAEAVAEAEAE